MTTPKAPQGYSTIMPFIISDNAEEVIQFIKAVFNAEEDMNARTIDTDELLLHAELLIGDSRIAIADRKPNWPNTPSLLQVYVDDVEATLQQAKKLGAEIVTKPTDFFGDIFSRFIDKEGNLWWVYQHIPQEEEVDWSTANDEASWEPTKEMGYIHDSLLRAMEKRVGKKK